MIVSLNWLKEYVDIQERTPEEICHLLTMSGSKVETIEYFGTCVKNVVTGKIVNKKLCTQDTKVSVLQVDIGSNVVQIVAKIPDIEEGDIVPVAIDGAVLKDKKIHATEIYGSESYGMICHVSDLGLEKFDISWSKDSGLICFPCDVPLGQDVNDILGLGDSLIEFEITPNRPDCLSIEGMAIELAATLKTECKKLNVLNTPKFNAVKELDGIKVQVLSENCNRYMMTTAKNVKIVPSDYVTQLKLIKCGIRPINNVVDATNYVMLEMGQPLHAFDKKDVLGNEIIVRQSENNEKIITLDGVEHSLTKDVLLIANKEQPMAMAGIMGGELSGIKEDTTDIIIEAASFNRGNIRITSRRQSLRSESSQRFEKGISSELASHALRRMLEILKIYKIETSDSVIDEYLHEQNKVILDVDYSYLNKLLGINLEKNEIDEYFSRLNLIVENGKVNIPYYRMDIAIQADLAEELARMYGLNNIKATLPNISSHYGEKTQEQYLLDKLVDALVSQNMCEAYNYSFVSKNMFEKCGLEDEIINMLKIANPLTIDFEYMRTDMVPSMLQSLERNYLRHNAKACLFENGKIYLKGQSGNSESTITPATEKKQICVGMYNNGDYYSLRNKIFSVLKIIGIKLEQIQYVTTDKKYFHPGISTNILCSEKIIASIGKLSPVIQANYDLPQETYIAIIDVENVLNILKDYVKKFEELPKFPKVSRDLSFTIDDVIRDFDIRQTIKDVDSVISEVLLFDVYKGEQIEKNKKSMSYTINMQSMEKTLEENDIKDIMNRIIERLEEKFDAQIRK